MGSRTDSLPTSTTRSLPTGPSRTCAPTAPRTTPDQKPNSLLSATDTTRLLHYHLRTILVSSSLSVKGGHKQRGKTAKKQRKWACLFYSMVVFSNMYALYLCGHPGKMSVIYPCFSWVGWGEGGLENEERVGVCIILLGGFLLWDLPSKHVVWYHNSPCTLTVASISAI